MDQQLFACLTRTHTYDPIRFDESSVHFAAFDAVEDAARHHVAECGEGQSLLLAITTSLPLRVLTSMPARVIDDTVRAHCPQLDTEWAELDDHPSLADDRVTAVEAIVVHPRPAGFTASPAAPPTDGRTDDTHGSDRAAPHPATASTRVHWAAPAATRLKAHASAPVAERLMSRPIPAMDIVMEIPSDDLGTGETPRWRVLSGSGVRAHRAVRGRGAAIGVEGLLTAGCYRVDGRWVAPLPYDVEHLPEIRGQIHDLLADGDAPTSPGSRFSVTLAHTDGSHWSAIALHPLT